MQKSTTCPYSACLIGCMLAIGLFVAGETGQAVTGGLFPGDAGLTTQAAAWAGGRLIPHTGGCTLDWTAAGSVSGDGPLLYNWNVPGDSGEDTGPVFELNTEDASEEIGAGQFTRWSYAGIVGTIEVNGQNLATVSESSASGKFTATCVPPDEPVPPPPPPPTGDCTQSCQVNRVVCWIATDVAGMVWTAPDDEGQILFQCP